MSETLDEITKSLLDEDIVPIAVASTLNETKEPWSLFLLNYATLLPSLVNLDLPELANSTPAVFNPELVFPISTVPSD